MPTLAPSPAHLSVQPPARIRLASLLKRPRIPPPTEPPSAHVVPPPRRHPPRRQRILAGCAPTRTCRYRRHPADPNTRARQPDDCGSTGLAHGQGQAARKQLERAEADRNGDRESGGDAARLRAALVQLVTARTPLRSAAGATRRARDARPLASAMGSALPTRASACVGPTSSRRRPVDEGVPLLAIVGALASGSSVEASSERWRAVTLASEVTRRPGSGASRLPSS